MQSSEESSEDGPPMFQEICRLENLEYNPGNESTFVQREWDAINYTPAPDMAKGTDLRDYYWEGMGGMETTATKWMKHCETCKLKYREPHIYPVYRRIAAARLRNRLLIMGILRFRKKFDHYLATKIVNCMFVMRNEIE
jgi:hypothetical protein